MRSLNGGWSYSWQGESADHYAKDYNTIYEALANKFGANNVSYVPSIEYVVGGKYEEEKEFPMDPVLSAAKGADVLVVCVGENTYCETPGNLSELALEKRQQELVKELAKTVADSGYEDDVVQEYRDLLFYSLDEATAVKTPEIIRLVADLRKKLIERKRNSSL